MVIEEGRETFEIIAHDLAQVGPEEPCNQTLFLECIQDTS